MRNFIYKIDTMGSLAIIEIFDTTNLIKCNLSNLTKPKRVARAECQSFVDCEHQLQRDGFTISRMARA